MAGSDPGLMHETRAVESLAIHADGFGSDVLVVGTQTGEVSLTSETSTVLHTRHNAPVTQVLCATQQVCLVFSNRGNGHHSAAAYRTPALEQISGQTLHDCCGGIGITHDRVVVFTSAAIRLLQFNGQIPKVTKTIETKGLLCGAVSEDHTTLLVASSVEYMLVNLHTNAITRLFPIAPNCEPLVCTMGRDFLVVQGTGMADPAMGLFVDSGGEVARHGTVLQWDCYPASMASVDNYLLAVVNHEVVVHEVSSADSSVQENVSLNNIPADGVHSVIKLRFPAHVTNQALLDRLGDHESSQVLAEIAFILENGVVRLWSAATATASPCLLQVEQQIATGEITSLDPKLTAGMGAVQLQYLGTYLVLHLLNTDKMTIVLREWQFCIHLELSLVLHVFFAREAKYAPGLTPLVDSLQQKVQKNGNQKYHEFLKPFLRSKIKTLRRSQSTAYTSGRKLELLYAQYLCRTTPDSSELVRFLAERELKAREEILKWLDDNKMYSVLEEYFRLSGRQEPLAQLYLTIVRDPQSSDKLVTRSADELAEYIISSPSRKGQPKDSIDLYDMVKVFVARSCIEPETTLRVLTASSFNYDAKETLQTLKDATESGPTWRAYLQHLVHDRGLFRDDLATLVLADIIEQVNKHREAVDQSYTDYATQNRWPKPTYRRWLLTRKDYPQELLVLQKELWELMERELDWVNLMMSFESQLASMKSERTVLFMKLSLHEQAIQDLCDMRDYRTLIHYSASVEDESLRRDLAAITLRSLIQVEASTKSTKNSNRLVAEVLRDFLTQNEQLLSTESVLEALPSSTPFHLLSHFIAVKMAGAQRDERHARLRYAVAKANSKHYD